ncbi:MULTISPECIES: TetR/AcrR family transcriptional regulator [Streptomycetaceae]|uniref:TetR family transcriptional regulator n=1 Tax=Streptantibioticus cattleyicolor (strain ATCC 35852 / DSM 46488 / JCM 4925 / NBRC 14057 / NRRL 8057) TaxID=1003195 RepID=F8JQ72_STREN|nr:MULTISPECIES: TetR/AcrR family transcriptional regulator [Streptomycetaceae]AEW95341.1 TetR family transcriptional regulator [Streptantibioticus cattleyicolor NRRL 8057 = DSM 46488]MYS59918.1 TetR family transcriptional regulator [Streptomyces sp. SID5468]CCB75685.1 putative TetR-family transcriptional regulator [Streptantibioticus cattleyicolor NRRL 8057 = DSM 46488]
MSAGPRAIDPQASVWMKRRPGERRRQGAGESAGLDRGRIVRAAIGLLDADGLGKFSMRRLAAELGVTPMSVYWYVDNKDDLLEVALDEVQAEIPLPDPESGDWQAGVRELASGYRSMLRTHPWAVRLLGEYLNIGPRAVALSTAAYRVMGHSGLPAEQVAGALSTVFQFAYGSGTSEARWAERCRAAGVGEEDYYNEVLALLRDREDFARLAEVSDVGSRVTVAEARDREFAFALDCLVAGIEAMRDRSSAD